MKGNDVPSKLFCGFANWFGHIISDISGSSGTKGRGMGIPSPIWSWTNEDVYKRQYMNCLRARGFLWENIMQE